jgi:hypothetical protein
MARSNLQMALEDTAMFAVLELWDYAIIALIVLLLTGGIRIGSLATRPRGRLEKKIDLILRHLGIEYADSATAAALSEDVRRLAGDPSAKIQANQTPSGADSNRPDGS